MKKPPHQTKIAMKKHFSHFRKTSFSFSRRCSADSVAYIASSEVYHGSSEDIYNKKSSIIPRSSGQLLKTLGCQRSLTAKSSSFEKKAHRSKSLTQIDCLDPNSQRLMKGDGLDASGTGTGSRHQQSRLSSHKCDSSPESANSVLNDLHYSSDRLVVPSLHHTSSLVIDDEDNVRRFKHHHHHSTLSHPDYLTLSLDQYKSDKTEESYISSSKGAPFSRVRKGYLEESGSSISQDGTLKSSKGSRGQLTRRSGGIFSNPFKTDREKMDQLTELLNQYSQHGIPEQMGLLNFKLDSDLDDYGGGITVSSGVGGGICHVSGSCESSVSLSDESLYLEDHWRVIVTNWESMPKKLQNQQDAIWELLHTEVFYIKRLKVISDLFLSCLCNLQSECLLNDIDTEKMFSNITEVYSSNHYFWVNHLLPMLKASRENHQPLNPIMMKDGFLKFEEIFHPYVKYCLEHSNCLQYVKEKHKESELFKAYVVWCETRKDCDRLRLMDLLVKPMQRLTKYSLLLKAILKKTEAEDQKTALKQMNENVEKFVCRVDACLRRRHDQEKLASIVSRIESYDALDSSNDEVEKVLKEFTRLNLTCPMPGCLNHRIRQLLLEGSGLKIRDSYTSSKLDVHCFLFTDILLICKSVGRKGDKVRVIRQPFLVDRIVTHELKDGSGFIVIYLNEFNVASAFFTLYTTETRTWLELIKRAQDHYREAKQQSALYTANQSSSLYRSTVDDGDEDSDFPSTALLVTNTSPRSSRSSLMHSASGSMDISDSNLALGSNLAIAPSTTPNLLLSQNYGATENDGLPSRAISFELGELRNPSMTADDLEPFGRSHSMETRPPPISVTVTSPRPERRAFLLRGAGGSERSGYEPMYGSNTLSVNVPSLHVNKQSLSSCSTSSGSTSAVSRSTGPAETSIQVPVLSKQSQHHHHQQITKSSTSPTSSSSASSIPAGARQRSISPRSLQRSLPVTGSSYSVTTKPPLVKMKNITGTGLKVHSAPPSEGPSPVHSFDSEGNEMLGPLSGSDGHIETSSACHSGHPTGYVSSVISIGGSSSFSGGGYTGTNNNPSNASFGNKQNMATMTEESDLEAAKSRLHQKRSVRGERRYHTADSIENMKKEKDSSIHKRLSWNFGQQSGRQSSGSMGQTSGGHERVLCNKHFNKCLSSESVYTSSGFSSTGSVPLSVTSCECDQCGIEVLSHIQEIEGSAESPTTSTKELSEHNLNKRSPSKDTGECSNSRGPNGNGNEPGTVGTSDIKIDVSEVKDGISSVQITVSGANLGKPSKSDLKKMKEFLLTSLEASEV